jgi:hypothetical protein
MLTTSRWIGLACLLSLTAAGCGGDSSTQPDNGADASTDADSGTKGPGFDSSVNTEDGSTTDDGAAEAGASDDGSTEAAISDAAIDSGSADGAIDGGSTEGGSGDGGSCGASGPCQTGQFCVSGVCCTSACNTPPACQTATGATCPSGLTCVYANIANNTACDDGNACTSGEKCTAGACGGGTAVTCNDGNPCTDDSCDMVLGCKSANNTAVCDDGNPCTIGDVCAGGLCKSGSEKDCTTQNDACNVGVCNAAGTCVKSAKANNTGCNDNLKCTATDVCTGGVCTGTGDSCGANATACAEGTPPVCTCATGFVNSAGQCVPTTNECAANPCVANATCNDPDSAPNDVVCTCPAGFTGNGKTAGTGCTQIDNCAGNPCGAGLGTCVNGINTHTCNCNAGYVSVGGACVCDMNGTFASQVSLKTSWSGLPTFEDGTNVPSTQWAIRTQTYDSTGHLVIQTTQCGGTTLDLCETSPLIGLEAYAEFLPGTIFGTASMPVGSLSITLTNPLPGQAYTEPQNATLLGISLTDPLGPWPAASANIGAGANQTNGALWVDNDNDHFNGVTTYSVPPGGVLHSASPFPIQDYLATSSACPRSADAGATRDPYNYVFGLDSGGLERVKRLYTASRVISSMSGTISSCNATGATLIQGTIGGPDSGQAHIDGRVGGCVRVSGTSGEANCSATLTNMYDGQGQTEHITSGSFIIKRVANTVTCDQVRAMTFP